MSTERKLEVSTEHCRRPSWTGSWKAKIIVQSKRQARAQKRSQPVRKLRMPAGIQAHRSDTEKLPEHGQSFSMDRPDLQYAAKKDIQSHDDTEKRLPKQNQENNKLFHRTHEPKRETEIQVRRLRAYTDGRFSLGRMQIKPNKHVRRRCVDESWGHQAPDLVALSSCEARL